MAIVKIATLDMFEDIYSLLLEFNNKNLLYEDWKNLFTHKWGVEEDHYGLVLEEQGEIVGFIGTVFSYRNINGRKEKICNLTSWIVKKKYRNQSLLLILPLLKMKDCTFVIYTAVKDVSNAWIKLGFQEFEPSYQILPLPYLSAGLSKDYKISNSNQLIESLLNDYHLRIYEDHIPYKSKHLIIYRSSNEDDYCYIIFNRTLIKGVSFCHIHYVSDKEFFSNNINRLRLTLLRYSKTLFVLIPNRYLLNKGLLIGINYKFNPQKLLFKSLTINEQEIDNLYSELILLNY